MRTNKALRIAWINGDTEPPRRYRIELRRDGDKYCWYGEANEDTEVSGRSMADAINAATMAWGSAQWDLAFGKS